MIIILVPALYINLQHIYSPYASSLGQHRVLSHTGRKTDGWGARGRWARAGEACISEAFVLGPDVTPYSSDVT